MSSIRDLNMPCDGFIFEGYENKSGGLSFNVLGDGYEVWFDLSEPHARELRNWLTEWLGDE